MIQDSAGLPLHHQCNVDSFQLYIGNIRCNIVKTKVLRQTKNVETGRVTCKIPLTDLGTLGLQALIVPWILDLTMEACESV